MEDNQPIRVATIAQFHKLRGLPAPEHPMISMVNYDQMNYEALHPAGEIFDFYTISIKKNVEGKFRYGHLHYDFEDGIMFFTAPDQHFVFETENLPKISGWMMLIHPDFLWNTSLVKLIKEYDFFDYAVNEALFLSEKEENTINHIVDHIQQEYSAHIDQFSKQIIITHLENLLSYADRFYHRQFITREIVNHEIVHRLESVLDDYFSEQNLSSAGLPTVQYISENLNISPTYLLSLLKKLTGQTTQQLIHKKLIEKAKEKLSTTNLTVSEIAYELGFEHSQSFSKLFKSKTNQTPLAFRAGFN